MIIANQSICVNALWFGGIFYTENYFSINYYLHGLPLYLVIFGQIYIRIVWFFAALKLKR